MGTMVQRHTLDEAAFRGERFAAHSRDLKGDNDLLVLTRPDVVSGIHHAYLEAGSDIIETNTFSGTAIAQSDYGLESIVYELNVEAARLARAAVDVWTERTPDRPRFVAGAIGPTNRTLSISPDVNDATLRATTFDALRDTYFEQARGLVDGGCDLLLVETIFDTLNAKAALVAIRDLFDERGIELPLMISVTITDRSGRTLSGQTIDAFYVSIAHACPLSVGINCALGARDMRPYLADLAGVADCYVSCYPNAGLPNAFGEYDELPDETGTLLGEFATSGFVNIVGGCCGTTPDHIRAIAKAVDGVDPRRLPARTTRHSRFSGLETLIVRDDSNFLVVGERTNVTGSKRFARLIKSDDVTAATEVAVDQGARRRQHHRREHGRGDARVRTGDDQVSQPDRHRAGDCPGAGDDRQLEVVGHRGRAEVRPGQGDRQLDQLEGRRGQFSREGTSGAALRRRRGGDGVRRDGAGGYDHAQSRDLPARLHAADRDGRFRPTGHHLRPPTSWRIATGLEEHNDYAVNYMEATRVIKETCPGALVSGGVSNLSFSFRGNNAVREAIHSAFLYHANQGRHGHGHRQRRSAGRL